MPIRRTGPFHKVARCMGLVLALARPGIGYGSGIEPDDQPQQQVDRGPITCVVSNDGYDVHFTAYARVSPGDGMSGEATSLEQFCQDIPTTGQLHLTLDLMNPEARTRPVAMRVVREGDDDLHESIPQNTLLEVPSKVYPTGVVEAEVGLNEPGEYTVLVDFDKGAGRGQVRIPLRVAQSGWSPTLIGALIGALLAALVAAWLVSRRFGKSET